MHQADAIAQDGEPFEVHHHDQIGEQDWRIAWHPPQTPPEGKNHGSDALCLTSDRLLVLVREDGRGWGLPGGRPEADEDLRQTLDREVLEEACASVETATLLGFSSGLCLAGPEEGLVLVRAHWLAQVTLLPWEPRFEMVERRLLKPDAALGELLGSLDPAPVFRRFFSEAGLL